MWKALHQLAIPERLYGLCGRWIPWLATLSALLLAVGLGWGFVYAPADYQQGELSHHVSPRPGGDGVNGDLCRDGRGGLRWHGLAGQNGRP